MPSHALPPAVRALSYALLINISSCLLLACLLPPLVLSLPAGPVTGLLSANPHSDLQASSTAGELFHERGGSSGTPSYPSRACKSAIPALAAHAGCLPVCCFLRLSLSLSPGRSSQPTLASTCKPAQQLVSVSTGEAAHRASTLFTPTFYFRVFCTLQLQPSYLLAAVFFASFSCAGQLSQP